MSSQKFSRFTLCPNNHLPCGPLRMKEGKVNGGERLLYSSWENIHPSLFPLYSLIVFLSFFSFFFHLGLDQSLCEELEGMGRSENERTSGWKKRDLKYLRRIKNINSFLQVYITVQFTKTFLLTIMLFQNGMTDFLLWEAKNIFSRMFMLLFFILWKECDQGCKLHKWHKCTVKVP